MTDVSALLSRALTASRELARASGEARNRALAEIGVALQRRSAEILQANAADIEEAKNLPNALVDRLRLDEARVASMIRAVDEVRAQRDPTEQRREIGVGRSGIRVFKKRVPLGVIAIVYEARPNVTVECSALTIKSKNAVVLRGGSEAKRSNETLVQAVREGLENANLPADAVQLMPAGDREAVKELLGATGKVDLVIPRGGHGLMEIVDRYARVPVIRHGQGICHVYVDEDCDPAMAVEIAFNAKVQRPGVCNAMETLLIHDSHLEDVLIPLGRRLSDAKVELRADANALKRLTGSGIEAKAATETDWDTEFLGLTLAIRSVESLDLALDHIAQHGTHHTAAIVTKDEDRARRFLDEVDASCVLWNASTRFNDGGELGLGAEMGISTSKMHAYGPMSATELTTEKIVVFGDGQVRE